VHEHFIALQDGSECEKFLELSSEAIISEATPTNAKRATAWGVSVFNGEFLLLFV
jgi:hypothetical protein